MLASLSNLSEHVFLCIAIKINHHCCAVLIWLIIVSITLESDVNDSPPYLLTEKLCWTSTPLCSHEVATVSNDFLMITEINSNHSFLLCSQLSLFLKQLSRCLCPCLMYSRNDPRSKVHSLRSKVPVAIPESEIFCGSRGPRKLRESFDKFQNSPLTASCSTASS